MRIQVVLKVGLSGLSYLAALFSAFHEIFSLSLLFAVLTTLPLLSFSWETKGVKRTLFGIISAASVVFATYSAIVSA